MVQGFELVTLLEEVERPVDDAPQRFFLMGMGKGMVMVLDGFTLKRARWVRDAINKTYSDEETALERGG